MRALAVLALLALAACAEEPAATSQLAEGDRGVAVELPAGWHLADERLTPNLTDPVEVLAAATVPLRYRETGCAHVAGAALEDLGPQDAFLTLQERGYDHRSAWPDFPPRPDRFGPRLGERSEASYCVPAARFTDHWFGFSESGRRFHVLVAFGPEAPEHVRAEAWAVLDSLRIDPTVRPEWRASG